MDRGLAMAKVEGRDTFNFSNWSVCQLTKRSRAGKALNFGGSVSRDGSHA